MASKGCVLVNWQPRHQQDEEATGEDASTGSADTEPNTLHVSRPDRCGSSSRLMGCGMPDYGFGRCDGHHKMIDFRLKKAPACAWFHQSAVHQAGRGRGHGRRRQRSIEHVAGVDDFRGRGGDLPGGGRALAKGADHAAPARAGGDEELDRRVMCPKPPTA
jgi:hypothetical protein